MWSCKKISPVTLSWKMCQTHVCLSNIALGCRESQCRTIESQLFFFRSRALSVSVCRDFSIWINHCNVLFLGMASNHLYCVLLVWRLPLLRISCNVVVGLHTFRSSWSNTILWRGVSSSVVCSVDVSNMISFLVPFFIVNLTGFPHVIHWDWYTLNDDRDMAAFECNVHVPHLYSFRVRYTRAACIYECATIRFLSSNSRCRIFLST